MDPLPQTRIMQNGAGWYWEVVTQDRGVIARGVAETHVQARNDADTAVQRGEPTSQSFAC